MAQREMQAAQATKGTAKGAEEEEGGGGKVPYNTLTQ